MKVTLSDVDHVSELAHLELTADERTRMERDLNSILTYIDMLNELKTDGVDPMAQVSVSMAPNPSLRADETRSSLPHDDAMSNAPQTDRIFFKVPKVIER